MSKLYDKYEKLKSEDLECIYLFLCGNFYIALDSDAMILNELFDMKLTKFSNLCVNVNIKCHKNFNIKMS